MRLRIRRYYSEEAYLCPRKVIHQQNVATRLIFVGQRAVEKAPAYPQRAAGKRDGEQLQPADLNALRPGGYEMHPGRLTIEHDGSACRTDRNDRLCIGQLRAQKVVNWRQLGGTIQPVGLARQVLGFQLQAPPAAWW